MSDRIGLPPGCVVNCELTKFAYGTPVSTSCLLHCGAKGIAQQQQMNLPHQPLFAQMQLPWLVPVHL